MNVKNASQKNYKFTRKRERRGEGSGESKRKDEGMIRQKEYSMTATAKP